ncbi:DEAD-box ATP-dependent RNA helicase 39-like [Punica granatum]|uniref:DEAD-box ATP-dependent RNA helicase 39-like n=1 Tax=Punica granatum TaxID=22663 RepID=A0A6P8D8S3_PUNGR|nr:DEAD-box ATP-dependent RNA helicase 39-like [Punica granatum]
MRGGAGRALLRSLSFSSKSFPSTNPSTPTNGRPLQRFRHLAAAATKRPPPPPVQDQEHRSPESRIKRDSMILEMFKLRQLKSSGKDSKRGAEDAPEAEANTGAGHTKVVSCFEELGLSEEVVGAIAEMGVVVPSEVQCVGIPVVLEGKSLVLLGPSESGRTWAYLLPLVQRLRKDRASFGLKRESPRAIVLCPSEELCDQVFCAAKLISSRTQLKTVAEVGPVGESGRKDESSAVPIGMLVGTPEEILQQIDDEDFTLTDIRYIVLDDADIILDSDYFPKILKIFNLLKNRTAEDPSFQTILVASISEKMLGEELLKRIEQKESGKVTAMILEMDLAEVSGLFESPDALRKRVTTAVRSLA